MAQPQVLIVTSQEDAHTDIVIEHLNNSKLEPIRLNTDFFIKNSNYSLSWDENGNSNRKYFLLKDSLRSIQNVRVIWWRRPGDYTPYPEVTDEWAQRYCREEAKALIKSLPGLFPQAAWINNYYKLLLPFQRLNQIPLAHELGIKIPPTLVTNEYESAISFIKQYTNCIVKPLNFRGFVHGGNQYTCYTRPIDLESLELLRDSIHLSPVLIQKRIEKTAEYRVTLIGKKSFVCRIESKHLKDSYVEQDWRVTEPENLIHVPDLLPDDYMAKLYKMLDKLGLHFGAFDIIRNNDDFYFIEMNPTGQWLWIELLTGMPMVKAMVELMEELANL